MVEKNLSAARGLNSIADPSSFRGSSGRRGRKVSEAEVADISEELQEDSSAPKSVETDDPKKFFGLGATATTQASVVENKSAQTKVAEAKAIAQDAVARGDSVIDLRTGDENVTKPAPKVVAGPARQTKPLVSSDDESTRVQKEMSIPLPVHEAVEATGYNVTDLLRRAYRNHAEAVRAGEYLRGMHRGRKRIRLSMAPEDYARLDKLARSRGWNRSETVTILLEAELDSGEYKN